MGIQSNQIKQVPIKSRCFTRIRNRHVRREVRLKSFIQSTSSHIDFLLASSLFEIINCGGLDCDNWFQPSSRSDIVLVTPRHEVFAPKCCTILLKQKGMLVQKLKSTFSKERESQRCLIRSSISQLYIAG